MGNSTFFLVLLLSYFAIMTLTTTTSGKILHSHKWQHVHNHHVARENVAHYKNEWIVKIEATQQQAQQLIHSKGFEYLGPVEIFDDYHVIKLTGHPEQHDEESLNNTMHLLNHQHVTWAQQLANRQLHKRDFNDLYRRESPNSRYEQLFNDDLWKLQWYEQDYRMNMTNPVLDMNLVPVYREYNITGNGVRILIIDDGLEFYHEDLVDNFDHDISVNLNRPTEDVTPRYEDPRNRHGTRCAGTIAMAANNNKCGVGIAYESKVGGLTLLDGLTNDLLEATALKFANDKVDIYCGSWGPLDNGQVVDGPGYLASLSIVEGVKMGRNGKGSLYVFAAGNGGRNGDTCAVDGYVASIYSIAITSATQTGQIPFYSEKCVGIMATTYSGDEMDPIKIVTTDVHNTCTLEHSGTSASAPLAAGILALVLQANGNLTWRDIQHLIVYTSEVAPLDTNNNVAWTENSFGLWYSNRFGFGLMNAFKMVTLALQWINVAEKYICTVPIDVGPNGVEFTNTGTFSQKVHTDGCKRKIRYLEHVQLNCTILTKCRGQVKITLSSARGTLSEIMDVRPRDKNDVGYKGWPFLTLQFWGEDPEGYWTVNVSNVEKEKKYFGLIESLSLILHGTEEKPHHYDHHKRTYDSF